MLMIARKQNTIQDKSAYYTIFIGIILVGVVVAYNFDDFSAFAGKGGVPGKTKAVQDISNGFPSGPHLNLNMHGRILGWGGCQDVTGGDPLGGNINIPLYDEGSITFVSNKKSSVTGMTVWDNCTENVNPADDTDPAVVQLPKNDAGWYVYVRILATPNNSQNEGDPSSIILTPDPSVLSMCNDSSTPIAGFEDFLSCDDTNEFGLMPIAVINDGGLLDESGVQVQKWEGSGKGKGRTFAVDMTDQFMWSGIACNEDLDSNDSGTITLADFDVVDLGDGVVNATDVQKLLDDGLITTNDPALITGEDILLLITGSTDGVISGSPVDDTTSFFAFLDLINECVVVDEDNAIWVFNAADLVIYGLDVDNDGAKTTQIRFYDAGSVNVIRTDP